MIIGIISVGLNVTLNLLLINTLAHVGLALSTSIAAWTQAIILGVLLVRKNCSSFLLTYKRMHEK